MLRKKATMAGVGAACLAGIPAAVNSSTHPHHAVVWTVLAVQAVLLANALRLLARRKRLLHAA